jgi:pimeloyl-ACP methyl ester carboxylesterase
MFVPPNHHFEKNIKNPVAPIAIDFDADRDVLLICFSGLAGKLGLPMFEFNRLTGRMEGVNKIYLRDTQKLWYHRGVQGVGKNITAVATFLKKYTLHPSTRRIVVIGNSGGAYAALLFGHLLRADEVHAFSPKTVISPFKRLLLQDFPRLEPARGLWKLFLHGERKYFDLQGLLSQSVDTNNNFHIYYSRDEKLDHFHAVRMRLLPGIHLHAYPHAEHNLIKRLRQSGELVQIIEKALQVPRE